MGGGLGGGGKNINFDKILKELIQWKIQRGTGKKIEHGSLERIIIQEGENYIKFYD